ncbi:MAG: AAA family ATPase [Pseudomonadota bacterium]
MYEDFFDLAERPFSARADIRFLYSSEDHELALSLLRYALMERFAISVVTGAPGVGKTTLAQAITHTMTLEAPGDLRFGRMVAARGGRGDMLRWILAAFDQPCPEQENRIALLGRLKTFLDRTEAAGQRATLIVDEAQTLDAAELEELRLLSDGEAGADVRISLMLFGQTGLRTLIQSSDQTAFAQRIDADFHMEPLTAAETGAYVRHRVHAAGGKRELFDEDAFPILHRATGGAPRLLNRLCDLSLASAYAEARVTVAASALRAMLASFESRGVFDQFRPPEAPAAGGVQMMEETLVTAVRPKTRRRIDDDERPQAKPRRKSSKRGGERPGRAEVNG